MNLTITQIAVLSRILIIAYQFVANILVTDHDAGVFVSPQNLADVKQSDWIINKTLGGFRRWDAQYYLHIAEYGYTYENSLAFYPLFPFSVRIITNSIHFLLPFFSFRELSLLVAILMNIVCFSQAASSLYRLSKLIIVDEKRSRIAAILFCFNPASIFFTAPYSESMFAWMSFTAMELCVQNLSVFAALPLSMAVMTRSNGLINLGFVFFYAILGFMKDKSLRRLRKIAQKTIVILICVLLTYILLQVYHYQLFCYQRDFKVPKFIQDFGQTNGYVLVGNKSDNTSPWCDSVIPIAYSYVQKHYWNVGFLRYYEIRKIPNFLLAFPMLFHILYYAYRYFSLNKKFTLRLGLFMNPNQMAKINKIDRQLFVFVVHATFLALFCLCFIHIEVTTRLLASSSPLVYWIGAKRFKIRSSKKVTNATKSRLINNSKRYIVFLWIWSFMYIAIGTVLFCNFLPWT